MLECAFLKATSLAQCDCSDILAWYLTLPRIHKEVVEPTRNYHLALFAIQNLPQPLWKLIGEYLELRKCDICKMTTTHIHKDDWGFTDVWYAT